MGIMIAFVGGMFFAGTPVEAAKGGGGNVIDQVWASIIALDVRITQNELDISGHDTRITQNELDISGQDTRITSIENSSIVLIKEVNTSTVSMDIYPKNTPQHLEFICPNNGIVESRTINFNNLDGVNLLAHNAEILGGSDNFLDGYYGIELDAQRTQDNGASFVRVTMNCISLG